MKQQTNNQPEKQATQGIHAINISDTIAMTARLTDLLLEETHYLKSNEISKISSLQEEKLLLTNALEQQKKILLRDPSVVNRLPKDEVSSLKEKYSVFEEILEENHQALMRATIVNKHVVDAVISVVKTQMPQASGYGYNGASIDKGKENMAFTPPLSVSEKI